MQHVNKVQLQPSKIPRDLIRLLAARDSLCAALKAGRNYREAPLRARHKAESQNKRRDQISGREKSPRGKENEAARRGRGGATSSRDHGRGGS